MFERAELGKKLSKSDYERKLPALRAKLVRAERAIKEAKIPVLIIISGVDGAGKGEVVHRLNEWLDPRGFDIQAFWHEEDEIQRRPEYWHFWQALPARGRMGVLFGSWYTRPITQRVYGETDNARLDAAVRRIAFFEEMLVNDGAVIIKLWFHLSKKALHQRLSKLVKNPETHWRVLPTDWTHHKLYDKFTRASERALRATDSPQAPWHLIEATDNRHRDFTAGRIILESLQKQLAKTARARSLSRQRPPRVRVTTSPENTILDKVALDVSLPRWRYEEKLAKQQARLSRLVWLAHEEKVSTIVVFEGWDAAGKGSAIRRVTEAMDPRLFRVVPIGVPTQEEQAHHYLWRFWRNLPADGRVTIFDRSWYGRVLVERVEKFAQPAEWMRAYREINDFEEQLAEHGSVLAKFWIHISKEEQLRRFRERESVAFKRHKIEAEDWRNRARWNDYKAAINDMVAQTSTATAPWTLVAGNDKRYARIQILKTLCEHLEAKLDQGKLAPA
jgi:AMP-polyphosphate phosphotransferase